MNKRQRKKQQVRRQMAKEQKENVSEQKKSYWVLVAGVMAFVASIVTILGIFDVQFPIRSKPVADIMEGAVSVEYLQNLRTDGQDVYPLFQDTISNEKSNIFEGSCATQVFVTNDYDDEILLKKIIFDAQDIKVNTEPVLVLGNPIVYSETETDLCIFNKGWGDAKDIILQFEDSERDINEYLKADKQSITVPMVKYGDSTKIHLWNSTDFLMDGRFEIRVSCKDQNGDVEFEYTEDQKYLTIAVEDGKFMTMGMGKPSICIYGIEIDTSEEDYRKEEIISESIKAHERLELPICFSADKSCELNFRIGFEVIKKNNKSEIIWTKPAGMEIKISSINQEVENVEEYSREELARRVETEKGLVWVTYPYIDKDALKYVEPMIDK